MLKELKALSELRAECEVLEAENARLRKQIEAYVTEFRVCRFCANYHGDCSPTDGSCKPKWRGL